MRMVKKRRRGLLALILTLVILAAAGFFLRDQVKDALRAAKNLLLQTELGENAGKIDTENLPWYLTLVNREYPVPEDWDIELTELRDDQRVDSRIYPDLQAMFDACRAEGLTPLVWSSYRTEADQRRILDDKIASFRDQGYGEESAREEALRWAIEPGYSEHQLGLSVDINSEDEALSASPDVYAWMKEHCAEYGFILRYPEDKEEITGIAYEAWHFRYVGREAAEEIMTKGICLEEYLMERYPKE